MDQPAFSTTAVPAIALMDAFAALADAGSTTLLLCASARQAQALHIEFARWRRARGDEVWATPQILGFESFVAALHAQARPLLAFDARPLPPVLSAAESRVLWRLVVDESRGAPLLRAAEAVPLAQQAWELAHDYRLALPFDAGGQADIERFNGWALRYRDKLQALGAVDATGLDDALLRAVGEGRVALPARCFVHGFDAPTPRIEQWLSHLAARGVELALLRRPPRIAQVAVRVAADEEQELRAAARWARATLEARPEARIAVIVPDLSARRADALRVFDEVLCPGLDRLDDVGAAARPYNLSLGTPLAQTGIVSAALRWLQICSGTLELDAVARLLASPYGALGGDDEPARWARAALEQRLRREAEGQPDLHALLRHARALRAPALSAALQQLAQEHLPRRLRPDEWSEVFTRLLKACGWPGPRALNSEDFQALQHWRAVLVEFARLEQVLGRIPPSAAIAHVRELAEASVFQPQTPDAPLQLLGVLEARGLVFDAIWVAALDDERWPAASRPHPFIPRALQRRHALPHANAARELAYAQSELAGWCTACETLVLSYARGGGEHARQPSPLLAPWRETVAALPDEALPAPWQRQFTDAVHEHLDDAYAPPPAPEAVLRGGASVLGDQARCPFRGFALHRLGAQPPRANAYGLHHGDRGELTHRVLERLWREWQSQAQLLALDDETVRTQVDAAVDAELGALQQRAPQRLGSALRALEQTRLVALLQDWLQIERERPPFRVLALEAHDPSEAESVTRFAGLSLRLRPDRIDADDTGRRIVIDYKTGMAGAVPWADGRPEDPQLLLYALTEPAVGALGFARLVVGEVGLRGIASDEGFGSGLRPYTEERSTAEAPSWDALHGHWRGVLTTLADEIRHGWAAVQPKHPRQSCENCGLHALCRIRDVVSLDEGEEVAG